jgi:hypothetical protein
VQNFQMLYFRDSVLEQSRDVSAREVVEQATGKPAHLRVEIWQDGRRVAEVGKSLLE